MVEYETVSITKKTGRKLTKTSKMLGFKKEEVVERAIALYIANLELKGEFKDWDELSDEALRNA